MGNITTELREAAIVRAGPRTRVLVIDSDPLATRVLSAAIESFGSYEVLTAADGDTALAMIGSNRFDCVLVDLLVGGVDGFTILARLRHLPSNVRPERLVVSSGVMDSGMIPQLAELGADAVLPRPFRLSDLAEALGHDTRPARAFIAYLN